MPLPVHLCTTKGFLLSLALPPICLMEVDGKEFPSEYQPHPWGFCRSLTLTLYIGTHLDSKKCVKTSAIPVVYSYASHINLALQKMKQQLVSSHCGGNCHSLEFGFCCRNIYVLSIT